MVGTKYRQPPDKIARGPLRHTTGRPFIVRHRTAAPSRHGANFPITQRMEMRIIEEGRQSMNNDGKIKQNRTTEAQQLDEGLKEMLVASENFIHWTRGWQRIRT